MNNKILISIISLLAILNVCLIVNAVQNRERSNRTINALLPYPSKYSILKSNIMDCVEYNNTNVTDCFLENSNEQIKLSELIGKYQGKIMILRTNDKCCNSCKENAYKLFTKLQTGKCQIVCILGERNNTLSSEVIKELNLSDTNSYNCTSLATPMDNTGFPYFMILDTNLNINYCYFPTKGYEEFDIENINMIIDCYSRKSNPSIYQ